MIVLAATVKRKAQAGKQKQLWHRARLNVLFHQDGLSERVVQWMPLILHVRLCRDHDGGHLRTIRESESECSGWMLLGYLNTEVRPASGS